MSGRLYRLGAAAVAHPWRVVAAWLTAVVAALAMAGVAGGDLHDDHTVPGTSSQRGADLLTERFPAVAGADARVVLHDPDGGPLDARLLDEVRARLADLDGAGVVGPPRLSSDRDTALLVVAYREPVTSPGGAEAVDALAEAAGPATTAGLQVELGGQVPEDVQDVGGTAAVAGVLVALVILLLAFGSVVAAGLPLVVAAVGLGIGSAGIALLAAVSDVGADAATVATMVGIGVGVDYALLVVSRHVDGLRSGLSVPEAAAQANATAGPSVLFAGATVLLSLLGLRFSGLPAFAAYGTATSLVVAAVMVASVTLVPALCGVAGVRLLGRRHRNERPVRAARPATARWAARVGRRPVPWAVGAVLVLLALAAPILGMRTGPQDAGSRPESDTARRAYDLVAAEYGPGANAPLLVAADVNRVGGAELDRVLRDMAATPGVATVSAPTWSPDADAAVATAELSYGPQDERTPELLAALRTALPAGVEITGGTAAFSDLAALLGDRLWLVVGVVLLGSLVQLTLMFRSVLVPLKAISVNLLSVGAAYGVLTAVFQWGWGVTLVGLDHPVPVATFVPLLMFAVLFGLSMNYEVFLLSRIREHFRAGGDAGGSVVSGLASTGRLITSAAAVMVAVFVGFGLDADVTVTMIGVGMAVAVAVDVTVVRMVLVPAVMALMGRATWWLPRWLDRVLPVIDVHGPALPGASARPPSDRDRQDRQDRRDSFAGPSPIR